QDGVDDERLEPGVPGTTRLRCARVHLRGVECDLARVQRDRRTYDRAVLGAADVVGTSVDDTDRGPDERDGLLQADDSGHRVRCDGEDVGYRLLTGRALEPLDERHDAGVGDRADPGSVLGSELLE